jgi:anti-anti-sigma regulatory factor
LNGKRRDGCASGITVAQILAERRRGRMMRITRQQDGAAITLKIEGWLAGELANELERCWDELRDDAGTRVIRIDLAGVTFIDAAGRGLLARMFARGVIATAVNVMTKAVVEQLTNNL